MVFVRYGFGVWSHGAELRRRDGVSGGMWRWRIRLGGSVGGRCEIKLM